MKIVVNDANVLIDLVELELLDAFFGIDMEFHTVSLIIEELYEEQVASLEPFIDSGQLQIHNLSEEDFQEVLNIRNEQPSLSEQDCSAYHTALVLEAVLLTSDNTLRRFAQIKQVEVHGHLWIFDLMVDSQTLLPAVATAKPKQLCEEVNPKLGLPKQECNKRYKKWTAM